MNRVRIRHGPSWLTRTWLRLASRRTAVHAHIEVDIRTPLADTVVDRLPGKTKIDEAAAAVARAYQHDGGGAIIRARCPKNTTWISWIATRDGIGVIAHAARDQQAENDTAEAYRMLNRTECGTSAYPSTATLVWWLRVANPDTNGRSERSDFTNVTVERRPLKRVVAGAKQNRWARLLALGVPATAPAYVAFPPPGDAWRWTDAPSRHEIRPAEVVRDRPVRDQAMEWWDRLNPPIAWLEIRHQHWPPAGDPQATQVTTQLWQLDTHKVSIHEHIETREFGRLHSHNQGMWSERYGYDVAPDADLVWDWQRPFTRLVRRGPTKGSWKCKWNSDFQDHAYHPRLPES